MKRKKGPKIFCYCSVEVLTVNAKPDYVLSSMCQCSEVHYVMLHITTFSYYPEVEFIKIKLRKIFRFLPNAIQRSVFLPLL